MTDSAAQTCLAPHPFLGEYVSGPLMRCERPADHDGRHERYFTPSQTVIWGDTDDDGDAVTTSGS